MNSTYLRLDPFAPDAWIEQRSADPNICFVVDLLAKGSPYWINSDHPNQVYSSEADAGNNVNATPVDPSQYQNGNINPSLSGPAQANDPTTLGAGFGVTPAQITQGIDQTTATSNGIIGNAVNQGQRNLSAAAGATGQAGSQILGNAYAQQGYQQGQGAAGLGQAQQLADYNTQLGQQAAGGMQALGQQANTASGFYGGQGVQQMANAGQDRAAQLQNIAVLGQYVNQGPGPSAAEAQLNEASNRAQGNALSLANSGRGAGDAAQAQRQAMFSNAATQQDTGLQMAQLRAQEAAQWRQAQLQGMGQMQQSTAGLQGADIGAANAAGSLGANYAGLAKDYYQGGLTTQQGYTGQANQALGTGQSYNQGMTGNANTAAGQGTSAYDSLSGQANNLTQASTGVGLQGAGLQASGLQAANQAKNQVYDTSMGGAIQKYGVDKGVQVQNQQTSNQQTAAYIQGAATLGGALLTASDIRAKTNIIPIVEHFRPKRVDPLERMASIARL